MFNTFLPGVSWPPIVVLAERSFCCGVQMAIGMRDGVVGGCIILCLCVATCPCSVPNWPTPKSAAPLHPSRDSEAWRNSSNLVQGSDARTAIETEFQSIEEPEIRAAEGRLSRTDSYWRLHRSLSDINLRLPSVSVWHNFVKITSFLFFIFFTTKRIFSKKYKRIHSNSRKFKRKSAVACRVHNAGIEIFIAPPI